MVHIGHILFMGHFIKPPVAGAMFFNGLIHTEKELWPLLDQAKVVIEVEHSTPCRRCYYRKYLRLFKGYKFLLMWDYVTRRNFLSNYVQGYDRIFSVHADAETDITDRWGHPAKFWPHGYEADKSYPITDRNDRYDIGFCGFLGERSGWEKNPIYSKRREVIYALKKHFGDRMCLKENVRGEPYNRFWNECKVAVNCSPLGEATLRVYEVLAAGTALVTDRSKDIDRLFKDGHQLLIYDTPEEAISCCERLLSDLRARKKIAYNGYRSVLKWERSKQYRRLADKALRFLKARPLTSLSRINPLSPPLYKEPNFS